MCCSAHLFTKILQQTRNSSDPNAKLILHLFCGGINNENHNEYLEMFIEKNNILGFLICFIVNLQKHLEIVLIYHLSS